MITTRIGEYVVGWHEGKLAIMTVDECIELREFNENKSVNSVNYIYEVNDALSEFERDYGFEFNEVEKHDIITFCCLSSIFQDQNLPFRWEDVLIFRNSPEILL